MKTIRDLDLAGRRVLMRVDFNVPQDKTTGAITSTFRLEATLPTIQHALSHGASLVLVSHLGRPNGRRLRKHSLRPASAALKPGEILLLENLRYHLEEERKIKLANGTVRKADPGKVAAFGRALSRLGDVYVNDAFGAAHRAHSSIVGVSLPQKAAGLLLEKELTAFAKLLQSPRRPVLAILGGAKIKDKIPLIRRLMNLADEIIIAGGMAFTFKQVLEVMPIGDSLFDRESAPLVPEFMALARARGVQITLPVDFVCADKFGSHASVRHVSAGRPIPAGWMGLDAGPKSRELFSRVIARCSTIVWNGPPGVFEWAKFAAGTRAMAGDIARATERGATTIIGGGDTATAAEKFGIQHRVTHCSTGGGAGLELMEGKTLPGVAFLET
jgi:phosphoglycerate kinase